MVRTLHGVVLGQIKIASLDPTLPGRATSRQENHKLNNQRKAHIRRAQKPVCYGELISERGCRYTRSKCARLKNALSKSYQLDAKNQVFVGNRPR